MRRISSALLSLMIFLALPVHSASGSTLSWTLNLEPSRLKYEDAEAGRVRIAVDGYGTLEYFNYPALPYRVVSVLLPQGEDISSFRIDVLDRVSVVPAKPLALFSGSYRDDGEKLGLAMDQVPGSEADAVFPSWRVRHLGTGFYRGYRLAQFAVYPIRYDMKSGDLTVENSVRLVVETAQASVAAAAVERMRYIEGFRDESRKSVEEMCINPEMTGSYSFDEIKVDPGTRAFLPSYEPSMEGSDVKYLIVTNEAMASAFQRLADWKTKKGIPSAVRTVEYITQHSRSGADLAETLRNFIADAYAKWGVEYVLLAGDTDVIPARFGFVTFYTGEFIPTDMYYSCLDGTWNADGDSLWGEAFHSAVDQGDNCDLYAEVYLGRLPASTSAEATILVNKVINYSTPSETASKSKFLMLAEVVFPSDYHPGDQIILDGAEIEQSVYNSYLAGNPEVTTTRLYENYPAYAGSLTLTRAITIDSMSAGANHILHTGHGYKYNMSVGDGSILNYDAMNLSNGQKLFSMYLMSCTNVAFDTDCLAEYFLLNPNGGAFAVTGSSRSAFPSASRPYLDEYYRLLFTQHVVQLGKLQTLSREPFTASAYGETADRWTHFIYNYLGDPELCIFQGSVKTYAVTKPGSAGFGSNSIQVGVTSGGSPADSAMVCLYKKGDDYAYAATGLSGTVTFPSFLCKSAGPIYVTVTGLDHRTYRDSIMVVQQAPAYVRVNKTKIEDYIVGNNDLVLDAGETANLQVELKNTGQTGATKLYAIVRSTDSEVTVIDSTSIYPDLLAGAKAYGLDPMRFSINALVPDMHPIEFTIDVRDSTGGFWSEKFALAVHAPAIELYVSTLSDTLPYGNNNGIIEEGENFLLKISLKNFGLGVAQGITGRIRSLDSDIVVVDSTSSYADIALLGVAKGEGFVLSERNLGQINYCTFEAIDRFGRMFTKRMELRKPGTPKAVALNSSYGPNEIHATWRRPDSLEAYRYQVYHSQTQGGPYTLANSDLIRFTLYRDTGLAASTRYYYLITLVDSCGNEGPASAEQTATTSPPQLSGWPNKMAKETASSVKIGDITGDGRPEVVAGSDFVYAWHGNGIEVRDGDSQPLTWGVFNTLGSGFTATVALANLDGVPGLEIVGASWNTKQIFIFNKDGAALPGWPKTTSYLCWASPVVGDIDGDGDLEIFAYDVSGKVYAWHHNGTEVRDGDANPATDGVFFVTKNPGTWHMSTPAMADMDEDNVAELIVCSPGDSIYCLNGNGSRVPGWPLKVVDTGANITASPAVGDIDGDGHLEVVVQSSAGRVYGLNHDATWMTGWPVWIYSNTGTICPSPALADLDNDGKLEIVIAGLDRNCYILRYNGVAFSGWPQAYATTSTSESSPIVADINGDGSLDILLACEEGRLNAWKQNGQSIAGFPIRLGSYIRGTPMVCDLDYDGDLELAATCWDANVYVWDLTGANYNGCMQWNGFHGNIYNSGWKEFIPATAVEQITCVYRLFEDMVELNWSVYPDVPSWNLYRELRGGDFEILVSGLRAGQTSVINYADRTAEAGLVYRYRLEAEGRSDLSLTTGEIMLPVQNVRLYQNHPNPFNPSTVIPFTVPGGLDVQHGVYLAVYDVNGALVKTLVSGTLQGGRHEVRWDGRNERGESVATGIYFAQVRSGGFKEARKMILLR
ncbi:MAG: C25 family cysteine peptidase [Candidatus Krumholzibacteriia bacterium]